jgi:hypothetical protein
MRILKIAAVLAPLLLLPSTALPRSTYAPSTLDYYFSLFVYNRYNQPTDRMRLSIDQLDAAGQVVGNSTTWVLGGVPPNNRTWFSTHVPRAASYRVEILSFDWVGRGA